jgi:hypothetical protein
MAEPLTTTTLTATVATAKFPTTLLLLFFVTTPTQDPMGQPKLVQETKAVWTLQSTSEIQTPDPNVCAQLGNQMIAEFNVVNTVTLRAYCLCPVGDGKGICLNDEKAISEYFVDKTAPTAKFGGTVKRIGPRTLTPFNSVSAPQ